VVRHSLDTLESCVGLQRFGGRLVMLSQLRCTCIWTATTPTRSKLMRARNLVVLVAMVLAAVVGTAVPGAFAQTETGRITGHVTDPQGAAVPGATVTATNVSTGATRTTVTDETGSYVIANVLAAPYEVSVQLQGFKTSTKRVTLPVGFTATVDTKLELGALTETVQVTAAATLVNVPNAEVATTVSQEQIRELPTLTRNPYDLVTLAG